MQENFGEKKVTLKTTIWQAHQRDNTLFIYYFSGMKQHLYDTIQMTDTFEAEVFNWWTANIIR